MLVFLFIAFVVGLTAPALGRTVSGPALSLGPLGSMRVVQSINVILIFVISGFRLKTDAMKKALKQPCGLFTGWFSILAWTPLLGFVAVRLPVGPKEFSYGLALFCCVPTTLTSGAALVAGCKGASRASELALMITVTANLLGCFTTPLWLSAVLGGVDAEIDVLNLLVKLVVTLLLPTVFGKMLQMSSPKAAQFSKDWKTALNIFSSFNLVFVVWQSVSRAQTTIATAGASNIIACIACGIGLHMVFWVVNAPVFALRTITDVHQKRAIFLLGSQKTLPVSLAIIAGLPEGTIGDLGLMMLPCIFGHLSQLIIDAFLVDHWAKLPTDVKSVSDTGSCVAADAVGAPAAPV